MVRRVPARWPSWTRGEHWAPVCAEAEAGPGERLSKHPSPKRQSSQQLPARAEATAPFPAPPDLGLGTKNTPELETEK